MITMIGRTSSCDAVAVKGRTLLQHAVKSKAEWGYNCSRGTCARCRCHVDEGMQFLEAVTDAEWDRLEPEELDKGFRLSCQAVVNDDDASIIVRHKPYF